MTDFSKRIYDVRLWCAKPAGDPPWTRRRWAQLRPAFDSLVRHGRTPVHVHTSQIDTRTRKHAQFGRLSWSSKSDDRWVHDPADHRHFENLEVWAPSPTTCSREGRAPDIYFDITHLQGAGGYQWFIIAAAAHEIPAADRNRILTHLHECVRAEFPDHFAATATRPWGYPEGDEGFTHGMQEVSSEVSFLLDREDFLNLSKLHGEWS